MSIADFVTIAQRRAEAAARASHDPIGALDLAEGVTLGAHMAGWGRDPDGGPIDVHLLADDTSSVATRAGNFRPDVAAALGVDGSVGFDATLALPAGWHNVCAYAINLPGSPGAGNTLLGCRSILVPSNGSPDPLPTSASWIDTVNYYRTGSGLAPVIDNPAWSDGIVKHLIYLRDTPKEYFTGPYANSHSENPASPHFTPEGAQAGSSSDLGGGEDQRRAIETWMAAPFHAIGILRPNLVTSTFGQLGFSAGLDVLRGLTFPGPTRTGPILFPGNGTVVRMRGASFEAPNPLESCGYSYPAGLPLIVMLPADPPTNGMTASLTLPDGRTISGGDLCVVSEDTYRSSDPVYGPTGAAILDADNALLIIPKAPLDPGTQVATVNVPGQGSWSWSFTVTG